MASFMNESVDPCDDFFSFACGQFVADTDVEDGEYRQAFAQDMLDQLLESTKDILEKSPEEVTDDPDMQLLFKV